MAFIVLQDTEQNKSQKLTQQLEQAGHKVWSVAELSDVNALINNLDIELMVLDLDSENLDEILQFGDDWKGVKIVFQSSAAMLKQDFRTWLADDFISKDDADGNIVHKVNHLLGEKA
jgi:DNA-binding response OmpR family regulator